MADRKYVKYDFGKKCVCIGRVSTTIQSQTAQVRDLEDFAMQLGFDVVKMFFTTESGFLEQDDKQGWNLVTDFFESHLDYKVLICPELSRLSRKEHILHAIKDYLIANQIQLVVKDINFFLYNEWGEIPKGNDLIFALYASLADSEMRQKWERFTRSRKDNRKLGYSIGGKQLFGYERYYEPKDGKERSRYRINEKEAEEIRTIYRWYAFGIDGASTPATILSITRECIERGFSRYLHSKRNVNKCLKEQAYCGQKETHNRKKNPDYWNYHKLDAPKYIACVPYICTYPPILIGDDTGLFELVQHKLRQNNSRYSKSGDNLLDRSSKHTSILAKLIRCPDCGTFLNAEYRLQVHSKRPHLGKRPKFAYRCNYSRSAIHSCSFRRPLSLVMMDSVVWAYCRDVAFLVTYWESDKNIENRVAELEDKIANLTFKIQEYDIDSRVKTEDAILRTRTKVLKDPAQIEVAVAEYQDRVARIMMDLDRLKQRKQELLNEITVIRNTVSEMGKLNFMKEVPSDKTLLYNYIHKVVDVIDIVGWSHTNIVLQVHFKQKAYNKNEFICIYTTTAKTIYALVINSYEHGEGEMTSGGMGNPEKKRLFMQRGTSNNLYWDQAEGKFKVDGYSFSLGELRDYYEGSLVESPINLSSGRMEQGNDSSTLAKAPVLVKRLFVERLNCYDIDQRGR